MSVVLLASALLLATLEFDNMVSNFSLKILKQNLGDGEGDPLIPSLQEVLYAST